MTDRAEFRRNVQRYKTAAARRDVRRLIADLADKELHVHHHGATSEALFDVAARIDLGHFDDVIMRWSSH